MKKVTGKNSKFQKGSGVYTCTVCQRKTRETGQGESAFEMCVGCMELSQLENAHSDNGHEGEVWDCDDCIDEMSRTAKDHRDIYRKAMAGETDHPAPAKVETTEKFWDCECETDYIHPRHIMECAKCGASREDQPDSIVSEVIAAGLVIDDAVIEAAAGELPIIEVGWSARCNCYNNHNSNSGRCNARDVYGDYCEDCKKHCGKS